MTIKVFVLFVSIHIYNHIMAQFYKQYEATHPQCGDKDWIFKCLTSHPRHLASGHRMTVVRLCVFCAVTILNVVPIFDWYGLATSKSKCHTYICSNGIGLRPQTLISIIHSIVNTIGKTYMSRLRNQQT